MTQAESLYHLQEIDLQLLRRRKRLKAIQQQFADDQQVAAAQARVDAATTHLTPLRARARDLDLEMAGARDKAGETEANLYSGNVKNPKEMTEMQQEIDALRRRGDELEETLLTTMESVEAAESQLAEAEANLKTVMAAVKAEKQELFEEWDRVKAEINDLKVERERVAEKITPENLKLYDEMRRRKNNQPISKLTDDSCTLCGVEQTMQIARDVRMGTKLVNCINCGRILVYIV